MKLKRIENKRIRQKEDLELDCLSRVLVLMPKNDRKQKNKTKRRLRIGLLKSGSCANAQPRLQPAPP